MNLKKINDEGRVEFNIADVNACFLSTSSRTPGSRTRIWIEEKLENNQSKRFLFKDNSIGTVDFAEVFVSYLAKKVGVDCVNVYPATMVDEKGYKIDGILSESYLNGKQNAETIKAKDVICGGYNCVCVYLDRLSYVKNAVIADDTQTKMNKMVLFDFLTFQLDRDARNIEFYSTKLDSGKKYISLAPMFDNSWVFFAQDVITFNLIYDKICESEELNSHSKEKANKEVFDWLKNNKNVSISDMILIMEPTERYNKSENIVNQICEKIRTNIELSQLFEKFKKVDFEKIRQEILDDFNFDVGAEFIEVAKLIKDYQVHTLELCLEKMRKQTKEKSQSFEF